MKTLEYEGKRVFRKYSLPVPRGIPAVSPEEARTAAGKLGGEVVVKAQVHIGGRGKAGGIKFAADPEEAEKKAAEILGMDIRGYTVERVYIEEKVDIRGEYYIGITTDRSARLPVIIISSEGGMDIETVAREKPDRITKFNIDPLWGLHHYQVRKEALRTGIDATKAAKVAGLALKLYELYLREDATLVEINPAIVLPDGEVICGDSKLVLDDNAGFRHPEWEFEIVPDVYDPVEIEARENGISFVRLEGNIAVIGNGAGLVMSTLDSLALEGGSAANFLDIGGGALAERTEKALKLAFGLSGIDVVFINIFGGITRCDEVARGIVAVMEEVKLDKPVVVRLIGHNEEQGRRILEESGLNIHIYETMRDATRQAVSFSQGGA
ncbi:MAG: ADP-forming succinate--CoA ligase subunit beta [Bacillota bacterium]